MPATARTSSYHWRLSLHDARMRDSFCAADLSAVAPSTFDECWRYSTVASGSQSIVPLAAATTRLSSRSCRQCTGGAATIRSRARRLNAAVQPVTVGYAQVYARRDAFSGSRCVRRKNDGCSGLRLSSTTCRSVCTTAGMLSPNARSQSSVRSTFSGSHTSSWSETGSSRHRQSL